jgi:hypothetical protein
MLTPEQESAGNSSKENQQNCHLVIKLLQFLVILAACLVELVFRADRSGSNSVSRDASRTARMPAPARPQEAK